MQKTDAKTIFAFLWKSKSDQEKIPLSTKKAATDNGSIPKDPPLSKTSKENQKEDSEKDENLKKDDEEERPLGSWTWLRKICFVLSINGGVLYVLAFAWLLPCRQPSCETSWNTSSIWTSLFNETDIITNLAVARNGNSELFLLGFSNVNRSEEGIAAVATQDGAIVWKVILDFSPASCLCNLVDVNKDGFRDCIITGKEAVVAINSSDGYIFWYRKNFIGRPAVISSSVVIVECESNGAQNILVAENILTVNDLKDNQVQEQHIYLVTLAETTGNVLKYHTMPCDALPAHLISWKNANFTEVACTCVHKNITEVWTIPTIHLCQKHCDPSSCRNKEWRKLYGFEKTVSSSDVLLHPGKEGLLIAWSTAVAMVTGGSIYAEKWRTSLNGSRAIAMAEGFFTTGSNKLQVIIATEEQEFLKVSVMNSNSGAILISTTVENITARLMTSLHVLRGANNGVDVVLVEIVSLEDSLRNSSEELKFVGGEWQQQISPVLFISSRTYYLVNFEKENKLTRILTAPSVYESELDLHGNGKFELLLARRSANHTSHSTILNKFSLNYTKLSTCWWR